MKRLEASFSNPNHRQRVSGLDLQSIDIAENAAMQRSIHDFMLVAVDRPTFQAEGHTFNYRRISALGSRGTLLSVYMQQSPQATLLAEHSHVLLTASLQNPIVEAWSTTLEPQEYGSRVTELIVGELDEPAALSSIDTDKSPEELADEQLRNGLEDERDWLAFPRLRFGGDQWQYEVDGSVEILNDLTWIESRVRMAVARGFGQAVFKRFDPEKYFTSELPDSGQIEQKVVA